MARSLPVKDRLKTPYHNRYVDVELAFDLLYPYRTKKRKKYTLLPYGLPSIWQEKSEKVLREIDELSKTNPKIQSWELENQVEKKWVEIDILRDRAKRWFVRRYQFVTLDELIGWGEVPFSERRKRGEPKTLSSTKPATIQKYCEAINKKLPYALVGGMYETGSVIFTTDDTKNVYRVVIGKQNEPDSPNYDPYIKGWSRKDFPILVDNEIPRFTWRKGVDGGGSWDDSITTEVAFVMPYDDEMLKARSKTIRLGGKLRRNDWYYAEPVPLDGYEKRAKHKNPNKRGNVGLFTQRLADNDQRELAMVKIGRWEARNEIRFLVRKSHFQRRDFGIINNTIFSANKYPHNPIPYRQRMEQYQEWVVE